MDNNNIILSVIIPCYNNGNYLKEMIDCFLRQTSSNWELIIVDDGSTDDTPQLIRNVIREYHQCHFFIRNRLPKGSVVCRNIGFEYAKGKYICHLDADDLVSNTFVEHRIQFMESHPDLDYASFVAKVFTKGDNLPDYYTKVDDTFGDSLGKNKDLLESFLSTKYAFSVWCNIYKRSSIENIKWDENVLIYTDFSYIVSCIMGGLKHSFANLKEVDYYYRTFSTKGNRMCNNFVSAPKCESTIYLFNNILKQLETLSDSEIRKKQFLNFHLVQLERLLQNNQIKEAYSFVDMLTNHYKKSVISRLKLIISLSSKIGNPTFHKYTLISLYILLFRSDKYINRVIKKLINIIG